MKLSIYEIVLFFSYFLISIISLFYKYKISDYSNPINPKNKKLITYILLFLVYIPFIVCVLHIFYRDLGIQYTNYIIFNTFIVLLLTPLIIYKDKILSYKLPSTYEIGDLIDTSKYDSTGNLIDGKSDTNSIKLRAAKSEYFNRRDMDEGIYD
uniref:Uncharacterized protein n=1 Tax=viral metagenome TaxID=1070528 RepID=A0A6C0BUY7_9ZZZZ